MPTVGSITIDCDIIIAARIDACETQAYHQMSRIQAHGLLLLVVDPLSFRITHISANAGAMLDIPNDILIGGSILTLLTPASSATEVRNHVARLGTECETPVRVSTGLDVAGPRCFSAAAFLYRSDASICFDIEPPVCSVAAEAAAASSARFFEMAERVARSDAPSDQLAGIACEAMRDLTGFDRTCFCMFDRVGHGHVLGESNNGILPTLMDHHFPAPDIPQAARRIVVANPFRVIPRPVSFPEGAGRPGRKFPPVRAVARASRCFGGHARSVRQ